MTSASTSPCSLSYPISSALSGAHTPYSSSFKYPHKVPAFHPTFVNISISPTSPIFTALVSIETPKTILKPYLPHAPMYGHNSTAFPCAPDFQYHQGSHEALPLQYHHDHLVSAEFSSSCSSGCSSHGASPISNRAHECYGNPAPNLIQRSVSSHSLQKTRGTHKLVSDLLESETVPVRRVYSTGDLDLQTINSMHSNGGQVVQHLQYGGYNRSSESSSLSSESSMIIEGMSKACPYSPEEKKERIERYRSKRNQRNFNKTIKYACRKTLADSRPRIRGRFARNDEIEKNSNVQWSNMSGEEDEEEGDSWVNLLDAFSSIESNSVI